MSLDSVVPTALIRQLQISIRHSFSLPSTDLSSDSSSTTPTPPPLASIQDAIASLDPSLDPSARCGRCRGGLLCGEVSGLCVYCGEGFKGGERAPREISFAGTNAYKLLLESLGLDGSEAVNLDPESTELNKERAPPKASMILSDLLNLKLVFSPINACATDTETEKKGKPDPTTYDINLSGIDLDAVFKETKKETPQNKNTKSTQNQVLAGNKTSVMSSFAKWEPDFGSQPVKPSIPVKIENLPKTNLKKEVSEIETQADEEFDEWQDFAGLRATQTMSDSVEKAGPSVQNREPVKAEGDDLFDSKDVASSGLDQSEFHSKDAANSGLDQVDPEEDAKTSSKDNFPIENRESLNADEEDLFDDWKAFTSSGVGEEGLSGAGVKPESGLSVPLKNLEPLNHEDDLSHEWKNFTGPGVTENGLLVPEEKTAPISGDLFTVNMENKVARPETSHAAVDSFDEWNDFTGSGLGQSSSSGLEEKPKTTSWDPLNLKNVEEPGNMVTLSADAGDPFDDFTGSGVGQIGFLGPEEKTQPSSQDQLTLAEIGSSNIEMHVEFNESFDGWKDFTDSNAVQARLPDDGKNAEPISDDPLPKSTTGESSDNIGTLNGDDDDSFDDWKDFTSSSAVESGLPDAGEKNEPSIGGAESKKGSGSIDLWSTGVSGEVTNNVSSNGNTNLSDDLLDFMGPSQVNGTVSIQGVQINNNDEGSSDNWLDFAGFSRPTETKSEILRVEKKEPDDLFADWQGFTGSSQSVKPISNLIEKKSEDWLDFTGSGELKGSPEIKVENNGTSDGWLNFTGMNDVKRSESKSLSDDWQDFTSTGHVAAPVQYNAQDIDFGDFIKSSSSVATTDHVNFDSLNGVHSDPLSILSTPSNNILNPSSNSTVDSKPENTSDIQKFLSQMGDLSFMLKDELSIPVFQITKQSIEDSDLGDNDGNNLSSSSVTREIKEVETPRGQPQQPLNDPVATEISEDHRQRIDPKLLRAIVNGDLIWFEPIRATNSDNNGLIGVTCGENTALHVVAGAIEKASPMTSSPKHLYRYFNPRTLVNVVEASAVILVFLIFRASSFIMSLFNAISFVFTSKRNSKLIDAAQMNVPHPKILIVYHQWKTMYHQWKWQRKYELIEKARRTPWLKCVLSLPYISTDYKRRMNLEIAEIIYHKIPALFKACNYVMETPLHCAAKAGKLEMVSLLVNFGRNEGPEELEEVLRTRNKVGETALHEAARSGYSDVVEELLRADENLASLVDNNGISPLYWAVTAGCLDVVHMFIAPNRLTSYAGPDEQTALHAAVMRQEEIQLISILPFFKHKRGLRQEDPLSPLLFILVSDSLSRFLKSAQQLMPLHSCLPPEIIQYADDTLIISEAHPATLRIITKVLSVYTELSGLRLNPNKSLFVPIAVPPHSTGVVQSILSATQRQFPITYLG